MNSALQVLLNLREIYVIFNEFNLINKINFNNKFGKGFGSVTKYFYELLEQKYSAEGQILVPSEFKRSIGELNPIFKDNSQQDSFEFLNFFIDILHEDINLISVKPYIENPDYKTYKGTEEQLSQQYWANYLRRNCSFIYALFSGQMKTIMQCKKCNSKKVHFDPFNSLNIPIPESKNIFIYVKLFRLPFTQKVYFINNENMNSINTNVSNQLIFSNNSNASKNNQIELSNTNTTREKLKMIRKASLNVSDIEVTLDLKENNQDQKTEIKDNKKFLLTSQNFKSSIYSSKLSLSVPVKICLEVSREDKVNSIINYLRDIDDLGLEKGSKLTEIIFFPSSLNPNNNIINYNSSINDILQHGEEISAYEVLSTQGIQKLLNNNEIKIETDNNGNAGNEDRNNRNKSEVNLAKDTVSFREYGINIFNETLKYDVIQNLIERNNKETEYLVQISHRYVKSTKEFFFCNPYSFEYMMDIESLYLIFSNKTNIKAKLLYELVWEKYEHLLKNPSYWEKRLWWKENKEEGISIADQDMIKINIQDSKEKERKISNNESNNNRIIKKTSTPIIDTPLEVKKEGKDLILLNKDTDLEMDNNLKDNIRVIEEAEVNENNNNRIIEDNSNKIKQLPNSSSDFICLIPFTIKIVNKYTLNCSKCAWYNFCWGCSVNPFANDNLQIKPDDMIVIEWCEKFSKSEFNSSMIKLAFNHKSIDLLKPKLATINDNSQYSLKDCLDIFFKKESLDKDNLIFCGDCRSEQEFTTQSFITKLPPILLVSLKRFKYTQRYKTKLQNDIKFPLTELNLSSYGEISNMNEEYDLYGVICHDGNLNYGHYYSYIKIFGNETIKSQDRWVLFNDSSTSVSKTEVVESLKSNCYILIYKKKNFKFEESEYYQLIRDAYLKEEKEEKLIDKKKDEMDNEKEKLDSYRQTVIKNISKFYLNEPVITEKGKGFINKIQEIDGNQILTIKLDNNDEIKYNM